MDKYLGKKLEGRYEVMEIIGIGGMANVYKAYDVLENRVVAVKILQEEHMNNEDMRRRFKNESKAMAVLNHPNVMRVYDVSFSDRMQSIVMEYIDGITLKEYIEQQKVLRWKEAVHFTVQILRALQHAHDKGIVHRDIKPQNIMLLSDGTIKITDFGIARFARSETRTLTDKAIGSVHYISPEQAAGGAIDARTDLYAVGVILYEMLTGQVPFEADTPVSVALKQIQSTAVLPRELNPSIPEGLQEITMHAMEKELSKRYQSAAQMLRDIDEFKRDPSILFEYKYLDVKSPAAESRYSDAIQSARKEKTVKDKRKKKKRRSRRAPIIPVLAGVTAAFVIVSAAFIGWMIYLNNPFVSVEDDIVPSLVGELLLDGGNASGVVAFDDIFNLLRQCQFFFLHDFSVFNHIDSDIVVNERKHIQVKHVDIAFYFQNVLFFHFIASGIFDDSHGAVQFIQLQMFINVQAAPCFNMIQHEAFFDFSHVQHIIFSFLLQYLYLIDSGQYNCHVSNPPAPAVPFPSCQLGEGCMRISQQLRVQAPAASESRPYGRTRHILPA